MKTALITGAGSGIGKATAHFLYQEGWNLVLIGRNKDTLNTTASKMSQDRVQIVLADVTQLKDLEHAAAACLKTKTTLNLIVANAGLGGENQFGEQDRWSQILDTNLNGTYFTIQCFLPLLVKNNFSNIVIVSSVLARLGVAHYSAYCTSKAGLLGLMRSLAVELAPQQILVNAICPGWVNTQMARNGIEGIANGLGISSETFYEMAMQQVPLGKMSEPSEIAELIAYLARQKSVTGQTLDINNGSIMA